jgi:hypothetical protein
MSQATWLQIPDYSQIQEATAGRGIAQKLRELNTSSVTAKRSLGSRLSSYGSPEVKTMSQD